MLGKLCSPQSSTFYFFLLNKKLFIQVILACCLQFTLKHEKVTEVFTQH